MRGATLLLGLGLATAAHPQLKKDQIACLSKLDHELPDGWTITHQGETTFLVGGQGVKAYAAHLLTPLTEREDGDNEGVSLHFFPKALADSVETRFPPTEQSTYEFIRTRSFVVVVAYFTIHPCLSQVCLAHSARATCDLPPAALPNPTCR